jgi:FkbM family methyltransferase
MPAGHEFLAETEGFKFYFNTSDREMGAKMAIGAYESETLSLFKKMIKPGMICIDAGAQTGFYTLIMAGIAGSAGKVYSFEPNPVAYDLLKKNIIANELSNRVTAHNLGLSDTNEEIVASEVSNMYIVGKIDGARETRMKVVRCDNLVHSKVDFIKIDIEGSEPKAIEGMSELINTYHPIIVSEINEYWLKGRAQISSQLYLDQLKSFGYDVYDVKNYCRGSANPLTSIKQDVLGNMDVICIYNHKTV